MKKSVEELRSHTLDEELTDINKAIVLLKSNYEVQLIVGVKMVPFLLKSDKTNCIQKVFPQFKVSILFFFFKVNVLRGISAKNGAIEKIEVLDTTSRVFFLKAHKKLSITPSF